MTDPQWTDEALRLLDGLMAMSRGVMRIDRIQYALYRKMGWRPTVAQIREAAAMMDERRKST